MTSLRATLGRLSFIFVLAALLVSAGCKSAQKRDSDTAPSVEENTLGDSDTGRAMGLQTIHFALDSSTMDDQAKSTAKANAEVMKSNSGLKVQIEGHCDQRGGVQYNIALGERRANAVKRYLVDQGVAADRLTTISYGKERPIDPGTTEDAYAKNRRANFAITSK